VISTNDLYGGSYRIFTKIFEDFGIGFHFVDMQDPANVAAKINAKTKLIWVETPTNPMMNVGGYRSHAQAGGRQRHFTGS
jgi:cystathionine beta-lyase